MVTRPPGWQTGTLDKHPPASLSWALACPKQLEHLDTRKRCWHTPAWARAWLSKQSRFPAAGRQEFPGIGLSAA